MGRLDGKVAVITGGGNGIGRASAVRFAREGAKVVVADLLEPGRVETVAMITADGGEAVHIGVDVTNRLDNAAMAKLAVDTYGAIDVVLTAAGITHSNYVSGDKGAEVKWAIERAENAEAPVQEVVDLDLADFQKVMSVNLDGTFLSIQACLPAMSDAGGSIITIASIAAKHPDAGPLPYVTSKAAVWMLTKKLARMLAPAKIRVNAIGPGFIDTHMTSVIEMLPEDRIERFFENIPMGRKGVPDEIANTALFLASDEASYFTGEILHPDGGFFTE
jgi:NAD(P)-dependent dehydrogenase (short-subunit alcohol dehydrogenase family)